MAEPGLEAQKSFEELDSFLEQPPREAEKPTASVTHAMPAAHTLAARPLPPPRKAQGKGWATLWKVTAWLACLLIIAGGTAYGLYFVNDTYGVFTEIEPILVLAAFIVVSVVVGLSVLAGVMVVCGIARELTAVRHMGDVLRRRQ